MAQARKLGGGKALFPLHDVIAQANRQKLPDVAAQLDKLASEGSFVDIDTARKQWPGKVSAEYFPKLVEAGTVPSVHVQQVDGSFKLAIPTSHLPAPASDALKGATTIVPAQAAARGRVLGWMGDNRRQLLRGAGGGLATVVVGATLMSRIQGSDSTAPAAAVAATQGSNDKTSAQPAPAVASKPAVAPNAAAPAPAPPAKAPVGVPAPQVSARGRAILATANAELAAHPTIPKSQKMSAGVAKYFSTTTQVSPSAKFLWPGYFVAWVRAHAGAPVTPANGNWKTIDDMIAHTKQLKEWAPATARPTVGSVIFLNHHHPDRVADDAAIVASVVDDPAHPGDRAYTQIHLIRGDVPDNVKQERSVGAVTVKLNDPTIRGYAITH